MAQFELVGAATYATLTKTFYAGRKYPAEQVGDLANIQAPHGGPLFQEVSATPPVAEAMSAQVEEVALSPDVVVSEGKPQEAVEVEKPLPEKEKPQAPKKSVTINKRKPSPPPKKPDDDTVLI